MPSKAGTERDLPVRGRVRARDPRMQCHHPYDPDAPEAQSRVGDGETSMRSTWWGGDNFFVRNREELLVRVKGDVRPLGITQRHQGRARRFWRGRWCAELAHRQCPQCVILGLVPRAHYSAIKNATGRTEVVRLGTAVVLPWMLRLLPDGSSGQACLKPRMTPRGPSFAACSSYLARVDQASTPASPDLTALTTGRFARNCHPRL